MSEETEAVAETPEAKFARVETAIIHRILGETSKLESGLDQTVKYAGSRAASFMQNYLAHFSNVIQSQHRELSIFRRLETHMRNNTTTNEVVADTMNALLEHRESVQKANEAAAAEAQKQSS